MEDKIIKRVKMSKGQEKTEVINKPYKLTQIQSLYEKGLVCDYNESKEYLTINTSNENTENFIYIIGDNYAFKFLKAKEEGKSNSYLLYIGLDEVAFINSTYVIDTTGWQKIICLKFKNINPENQVYNEKLLEQIRSSSNFGVIENFAILQDCLIRPWANENKSGK